MANMPSQLGDYYPVHPAPAEVPEFDLLLNNVATGYDCIDQWTSQTQFADPRFFKQEPCHVPIPKIEPQIPEFDTPPYLENNWAWASQPPHHLPPQHHPHPHHMMSYQQAGSPSNQQLQLSDPPTPAAECQVTSTNLSPIPPHSPYSPQSEVGSFDGAMAGEGGFLESHFDSNELNEVNIKGLTEEQLVSLTARDLNRICREMPEDIVKQLKKRRRTLKNRGYAYNSRVRRVTQKTALETERDDLRQQLQQLTEKCRLLEKEADQWKRRVQTLERGQL